MDFGFTTAQENLRKEVHDFYLNELPEDYDPFYHTGSLDEETIAFWREFQDKGVERGYPTAGWPKKYGGAGFSAIEQGIVSQEMWYWGEAVRWISGLGYLLVGPTILAVGTEEQKERWVPAIVRGEFICLECLTEPDAGSDESNIQMRAVPDGDEYVLNGQKHFITGVAKPDWLFTLARTSDTEPKHRGLTMFMVPADAPGVSFRPQPTLGGATQNEVFYDDVRVPKKNILGELNKGFYVVMSTLEFERSVIGLGARRGMERWVQFFKEEKKNGRPLIEYSKARKLLAIMAMHMEVQAMGGWYSAWYRTNRAKLGSQPYDLTGINKKNWLAPEAEDQMEVLGLYGLLRQGSKYCKLSGQVGRDWEESRTCHASGTIEIQKTVAATRGLRLPRIPREFNKQIAEALKKATD